MIRISAATALALIASEAGSEARNASGGFERCIHELSALIDSTNEAEDRRGSLSSLLERMTDGLEGAEELIADMKLAELKIRIQTDAARDSAVQLCEVLRRR